MSSNLFALSDGKISEMAEYTYDQECDLQKIIADNPDLLLRSSDTDDNDNAALYLIQREQNVESLYLDHLMVDQDSVPVLVEVKRSSDQRIYREVAAQMLDYASRVSSWDIGDLKAQFKSNNPDLEPFDDSFWDTVETNLKAEHIKLVFAADKIPDSLKIIIEFLDRSMPNIEVYGVEIHQFKANDTTLLATNYIGSTLVEVQKTERSTQDWDFQNISSFFQSHDLNDNIPALEALIKLAGQNGMAVIFGHGTANPSVSFKCNGFTVFRAGLDNLKPYIEIPAKKISNLVDKDEDLIREMFTLIPSERDTPQYIYCDLIDVASNSILSAFSETIKNLLTDIQDAQKNQLSHKGKWNLEDFCEHLNQSNHSDFIPVLNAMLKAAEEYGFSITYGSGLQNPTVRLKYKNYALIEMGFDINAYIYLSIRTASSLFGWTEQQIRSLAPDISCRKDPKYSVMYSNATAADIPALTGFVKNLMEAIKNKNTDS